LRCLYPLIFDGSKFGSQAGQGLRVGVDNCRRFFIVKSKSSSSNPNRSMSFFRAALVRSIATFKQSAFSVRAIA
jgi:hypothetical protein